MTEYQQPDWLPDLVFLEEFGGTWQLFLEAIYKHFERDFVLNKPKFRGKRLGLKRYPEYEGKSATFWHMISEGSVEDERIPDIRRCERIRWPKPVIENEHDLSLKVWAEKRGANKRIHLWFENESYLVVLDDRGDFILPWTAFYIDREHQRRKYNKRFERNKGIEI